MAIRIDIPGIGIVEVEGAASEETLQRLAAALETSSKGLTKEQKEQAKATKDVTKALKENATGWVAAGDNLTQSFKNLALTATSVATKFFANYDAIAASPIKAGQALLNTAIDVTADFAGGLASAVPVVGGFLKGVVDATAALAKIANNALADQLQKNVDALREYAKTGVGFSNGMSDMQRVATQASLGIKEFSQGVTRSKAYLNILGESGGDAAEKLSKNLGQLAKKGPGGMPSLRDEIFKMGFSYEEQIDVAAQYMSQMAQMGRLEKMTKEELAKGTRDYARDLKVVADYTGKDAKAIQDRARTAAAQSYIQTNYSKEQVERFKGSFSALEKLKQFGPEAQAALTQQLTMGTINIEGFTQGPMRDALVAMAENIKNGTGGFKESLASSADALARQSQVAATWGAKNGTNLALIAQVGGPAAKLAEVNNALLDLGDLQVGQVEKSFNQNENMATSMDKLSTSVSNLTDQANKFQVQLQNIVNSRLDEYSKVLADTFKATTDAILGRGGGVGGESTKEMMSKATTGKDLKGNKVSFLEQYFNTVGAAGSPGLAGAFADGGKIPSGKAGIVGEAGPEMVVGPGTVVNAAQMRENFAKMFEEQTKFIVNAKNPFRQALDDVAFTPDGIGGQLPYDKQTGSIIDPNIVKDLSDKSNSWQKSVAMLSDKNTEMAEGMRNSTMGENGQLSQEMISSTNKQLLEALQQMKDGVTQQTMSMAEMLKAMGVSNSHLGKVAMNTN
jgi:hypothetical protein